MHPAQAVGIWALDLAAPGPIRENGEDLAGAVRVYDVDIRDVVGAGIEGYAGAVGRPGRQTLVGRSVREAGLAGAVGVHDVDLVVLVAVGGEGDAAAVGRPGGLAVRLGGV